MMPMIDASCVYLLIFFILSIAHPINGKYGETMKENSPLDVFVRLNVRN